MNDTQVYSHILVALDRTGADSVILEHVRPLARLTHARLTLIHVADGYMARNQEHFGESEEMRQDGDYLRQLETKLQAEGFEVESILAAGNPVSEILTWAEKEGCDLIAMGTHGHGPLRDLFLGTVASSVRHRTRIPMLLVRA